MSRRQFRVGDKTRLSHTITLHEVLVRRPSNHGSSYCEGPQRTAPIGLEVVVIELGTHPRKDLFEATLDSGAKVYGWIHHSYLERSTS